MTSRSMLDVAFETLSLQKNEMAFLDLWNLSGFVFRVQSSPS